MKNGFLLAVCLLGGSQLAGAGETVNCLPAPKGINGLEIREMVLVFDAASPRAGVQISFTNGSSKRVLATVDGEISSGVRVAFKGGLIYLTKPRTSIRAQVTFNDDEALSDLVCQVESK